MAEQETAQPQPRAITYKEVVAANGKEGADEVWRKIGRISGAGDVPVNAYGEASIDITGLAAGKVEQIDTLLKESATKKRGNK